MTEVSEKLYQRIQEHFNGMSVKQLRILGQQQEIPIKTGLRKDEIADELFERLRFRAIEDLSEDEAGYDYAVAIATQAEIEAGAACGQLAIIN